MVKTYIPDEEDYLTGTSDKVTKKKRIEDTIEKNKQYFDIWDVHPSFNDINNRTSIVKTISLLILTFSIIFFSFLTNHNFILSILIGIVFIVILIIIFHDEFFFLRTTFPSLFSNKLIFNPFKQLVFWYDKNDQSILYCTNRNDLSNIALQIYRVDVIPKNIHPKVEHFIRALSSEEIRIPFSYQIVQKPKIDVFGRQKTRFSYLRSTDSYTTSIYFSVFYQINGILTDRSLDKLRHYIKKFSTILKSNFIATFHHFRITLLSDTHLINAIRTFFLKTEVPKITGVVDKRNMLNGNKVNIFSRFMFCVIIMIYFSFHLLNLQIPLLYVIGINFGISFCILMIWWRSIFFQISKTKLIRGDNFALVNPFENIQFYWVREFPYSLFLHIDNQILFGMKMVNLKYIKKRPYSYMEGFFEDLNSHRLSYCYTLKNKPIGYHEFHRYGLDNVHEKIQKNLRWGGIQNKDDEEQWLSERRGMWYSIFTFSIHSYKYLTTISKENIRELEEELVNKRLTLKGAFHSQFQNYKIEDLRSKRLLSGFLFSTLKNNHFRLNGTQLYELMVQGITLTPLNIIPDVLKKGIITKIPAEFNTPLFLNNFITFGYTENTEVLEREVPAGFTLDQLKNLLIVNGTAMQRKLMSMKLVSELIRTNYPCLVFDFDGIWSKLLDYFKKSHFINSILYFKLGSAFTVDPLTSEIPFDLNNPEYLEYMYDCFAIAFKKDQRFIEMFRSFVMNNPNKDLQTLSLEAKTQSEWQKRPLTDSILELFTNFTHQEFSLFQGISGKNKIYAHNCVQTEKTVVLDLSALRDLDKKVFCAFLIISKIIHYTNQSEEYHKKIIIVPNIDLFFNANYIDWRMHYGKIDTFLTPLIDRGFGFIFSANQIRYLHSHVLNYFDNLISFRTTERRSILILKDLMNLQELVGTGYYSSTRNNTYQIEYLTNMKNNELLVRRDDIYQSFPAIVDWDALKKSAILSHDQIVSFMERQGYNISQSEQTILKRAKRTIFEKDLGNYYPYLKEVIIFLDEVRNFDQVGHNYKDKLKKHLKQILYPKISQKTKNKEFIKKIRDGIFDLLVKHGYLVEGHPKRASGTETLITSYMVGDPYQIALDDYFEAKGRVNTDIDIEILEKGSPEFDEIPSNLKHEAKTPKYIIEKGNLKEAFAREFSDFNYEVFKIDKYIEEKNYHTALKLTVGLIKKYLESVYRHFYNANHSISTNHMEEFITLLVDSENFPFSIQELHDYYEKTDAINFNNENIKEMTEDVYHRIFQFLTKIYNYIYKK
ncbi:MAG: hypothetical protein ACFFCV_10940 [Promethearchaeota archaeon]